MRQKKKNKKRRIKILKIVGVLVVLGSIVLIGINISIKNIYVKGNQILTDQEIIELAGIEHYPKLFSVSSNKLENKIKMNPVVESVHIKKNLFGRVDIEIKEYNRLLKDEVDNGIYLSNGKKVNVDDLVVGLPSLTNVVDEKVLTTFLKKLDTIDKNVLEKISEIEYSPNEYDKDLFLFYMNDGNYVYITTTRLLNINKYESVLRELDGKKGILYLDSGNHFEVLE